MDSSQNMESETGMKTRSRSLSRNLAVVLESTVEDYDADKPTYLDCTAKSLQALKQIDLSGPDDGVGGNSYTQAQRDKRNKFLQYVQSHPLVPGVIGKDIVLNFPEYIPHRVHVPPVMITMEVCACL